MCIRVCVEVMIKREEEMMERGERRRDPFIIDFMIFWLLYLQSAELADNLLCIILTKLVSVRR